MSYRSELTAHLLKLRCRDTVSDEEEDVLDAACSGIRTAAAREILVHERQAQTQSHLLLEGIIARQIILSDGRRQIVALHVPGDFVDLHSFLIQRLEHDVVALTPVRIALFPHPNLRRITETHPHLARLLWLSTLLDAALHREWVLSVGRRSAKERVAHLLCELHARLKVVEQTMGNCYSLPLSQIDIADACGLTPVHVNRVLRSLREARLAVFRAKKVEILDPEGLAAAADFDPFYLHLGGFPR
jgi:CRP-like cAMP-binding protein